ncbi:MAG: SDR family oxidoreductase [Bacteroidetes bacterium]|nr:SDR family oxidoreductase [Bacteroidota bacterium]MBU1485131.1 SDR family oxidoreductase [Bacteroidota bacterium]MBU2266638.1 SDR family oxidoreductase [Bacteroidota bacterium]MBU2377200.1 SDR family oxidoreductase [Bacteroidota bacterium]
MRILLTGANGYIGTRLSPILQAAGHEVFCLVRDKRRLKEESDHDLDTRNVIVGDLLDEKSLANIPKDIDAAYYLVHSMGNAYTDFRELEELSANNFINAIEKTYCQQIIYLTGIVNDDELSEHLKSRLSVENILKSSIIPNTCLRAAIIIGSGSASFEIIRDLTEKLPIMIAPKWLRTRCQPIAIRDVLSYLEGVLGNEKALNQTFDIGGPDILTYKEMLLGYAKVRKLKRYIFTIPVLTPRLSSYWLNIVTSVNYNIASSLVESMRNEVICSNDNIKQVVPKDCFTYTQALELAFAKIEQNSTVSSWRDALNKGYLNTNFMDQVKVPQNGTLSYKVKRPFQRNTKEVLTNIWSIGGKRGWYYLDWLWGLRGFIDQLVGGVGTRRGRRVGDNIYAGDALDFWRVLLADKNNKRLLLYAEMRLPGEAWLEFKIIERDGYKFLSQIATFRPNGLWGRIYWWMMWPFHLFIFNGMAKNIIQYQNN